MYERLTWAKIDLGAIMNNTQQFINILSARTKFCAVVKADGYGHGALAVANASLQAGADYLAVAILSEALELRRNGCIAPILIMGATPAYYAPYIAAYNLEQTIFDIETAEILSAVALKSGVAIKVHIKVDTGMSRLGVEYTSAAKFTKRVASLPGIDIVGLYTHFAAADSEDLSYTWEQLEKFNQADRDIRQEGIVVPLKHAANSAATMVLPESHLDMVRVGISLYGLWPDESFAGRLSLQSALEFKCRIVQLKHFSIGTPISYGCTYAVQRSSIIATLPVGYADGYSRALSNLGWVVIRGRRAPVVGTVCMDQMMVDVTDVPDVREGDQVLLVGGNQLPVSEMAGWLKTINYEVVTSVGKRVPRIYAGGSGADDVYNEVRG